MEVFDSTHYGDEYMKFEGRCLGDFWKKLWERIWHEWNQNTLNTCMAYSNEIHFKT